MNTPTDKQTASAAEKTGELRSDHTFNVENDTNTIASTPESEPRTIPAEKPTDAPNKAQHSTLSQRIVALVMEEIEERGYDLSDLGGKTCEEIAEIPFISRVNHAEKLAEALRKMLFDATHGNGLQAQIDRKAQAKAILAAYEAAQ